MERERLKVLEGKVYFGGKILNGIKVIEISFWKDERIFFFCLNRENRGFIEKEGEVMFFCY